MPKNNKLTLGITSGAALILSAALAARGCESAPTYESLPLSPAPLPEALEVAEKVGAALKPFYEPGKSPQSAVPQAENDIDAEIAQLASQMLSPGQDPDPDIEEKSRRLEQESAMCKNLIDQLQGFSFNGKPVELHEEIYDGGNWTRNIVEIHVTGEHGEKVRLGSIHVNSRDNDVIFYLDDPLALFSATKGMKFENITFSHGPLDFGDARATLDYFINNLGVVLRSQPETPEEVSGLTLKALRAIIPGIDIENPQLTQLVPIETQPE